MLRELKNLLAVVDFGLFRRWGIRGGFAVLDQGLFSGSNFVLNVLLARWLNPVQYGAFALGFALYIFLSGFHNALILEPLSVFGTSRYVSQLKEFLASQFLSHFLVTGILGLIIGLIGLGLSAFSLIPPEILQAIMGVGLSLPLLLFIWLARRVYYVLQKPASSFNTTLMYCLLIVVLTYLVRTSPYKENILLWFIVVGCASLLSSLGSVIQVWSGHTAAQIFGGWKVHFREQWLFGRWIVVASVLYSVGTQIQIFATASFLGLQTAGVFRAMQNFILPMLQILAPVSTLALPSIAFAFGQGNYRQMQLKTGQVTLFLVGLAICYELMLIFFGAQIEQLLYAGKYSEYVWLMPWIGLVPLMNAMATGYSLILRALQKPVFYLVDKAVVAIVGVISAIFLITYWKLTGAVTSLILIELSTLAVYWWLTRTWFGKSGEAVTL